MIEIDFDRDFGDALKMRAHEQEAQICCVDVNVNYCHFCHISIKFVQIYPTMRQINA